MRYAPLAILILLAVAGCEYRDAKKFEPASPATASSLGSEPATPRAPQTPWVVFAPVGMGALKETAPKARLDWAKDMSARLNTLNRRSTEFEAGYSETIPDSDDTRWASQKVTMPPGFAFLVLTEIKGFQNVPGAPDIHASTDDVRATVQMRVFDRDGNLIFYKVKHHAEPDRQAIKEGGIMGLPRVRAAWLACSALTGDLLNELAKRNELERMQREPQSQPALQPVPVPPATDTVEVSVTSTPDGADIIINGLFRGNTPMKLSLLPRPTEVQIRLAGYQTWTPPGGSITPSFQMVIQPRLQVLTDTTVPVEGAAPETR